MITIPPPPGSVPLRRRLPTLLALCAAAVTLAGAASASIDRIRFCGSQWVGFDAGIPINRDSSNQIEVTGFGVDLATSVECNITGSSATIIQRQGGAGSFIVINLTLPAGPAVSGKRVTIRYLVGEDTFLVQAAPKPRVTSLAFVPDPGITTVGGMPRLRAGEPHVLSLKGSYMDELTFCESCFGAKELRNPSEALQVAGELRVAFTPQRAGSITLTEDDFYAVGGCGMVLPSFSIGFTVNDLRPTATATPTRTPTAKPPSLPVIKPQPIRTFRPPLQVTPRP